MGLSKNVTKTMDRFGAALKTGARHGPVALPPHLLQKEGFTAIVAVFLAWESRPSPEMTEKGPPRGEICSGRAFGLARCLKRESRRPGQHGPAQTAPDRRQVRQPPPKSGPLRQVDRLGPVVGMQGGRVRVLAGPVVTGAS